MYGGAFEYVADSLHLTLRWDERSADGWHREGTADLRLPPTYSLDEIVDFGISVKFEGDWITSDQKVASSMSMQVRHKKPDKPKKKKLRK